MMRFFCLIRIHIVIVVFRDLCGRLYCGLCGPEISKALESFSWERTSHNTKNPNPNLESNWLDVILWVLVGSMSNCINFNTPRMNC